MTNHPRKRIVLGGLAAALGLSLIAAPAYAEKVHVDDPDDGIGNVTPLDVVAVDARFGEKLARVHVHFQDLRPTSDGGPGSVEIYIDTKPKRKGPEFRIVTGLQEGTDYQLTRMRDWKPVGEPSTCTHKVRLDFENDVVHAAFGKDCIRYPKKLRVGVKMTDLWDGSHPVTDWLVKPRFWTEFLASGPTPQAGV